MWQAPSLGSSRVMLGTELPPEHGVGKKRNKITARVCHSHTGPVIHTETGSQRGGGGCTPILESERGHVGLFVPPKLSTLLGRQKEETQVWDTDDNANGTILRSPYSFLLLCGWIASFQSGLHLCAVAVSYQVTGDTPKTCCFHARELQDRSSWKTH